MPLFRRAPGGAAAAPEVDETVDARPAGPVWGQANPCPDCGALGRVDHIDMTRRVMFLTCRDCGVEFALAEADSVAP